MWWAGGGSQPAVTAATGIKQVTNFYTPAPVPLDLCSRTSADLLAVWTKLGSFGFASAFGGRLMVQLVCVIYASIRQQLCLLAISDQGLHVKSFSDDTMYRSGVTPIRSA